MSTKKRVQGFPRAKLTDAYWDGYYANTGVKNPHPIGSTLAEQWDKGYADKSDVDARRKENP